MIIAWTHSEFFQINLGWAVAQQERVLQSRDPGSIPTAKSKKSEKSLMEEECRTKHQLKDQKQMLMITRFQVISPRAQIWKISVNLVFGLFGLGPHPGVKLCD